MCESKQPGQRGQTPPKAPPPEPALFGFKVGDQIMHRPLGQSRAAVATITYLWIEKSAALLDNGDITVISEETLSAPTTAHPHEDDDAALSRALNRLANNRHQVAPLMVEGKVARGCLDLLQQAQGSSLGKLAVFYQLDKQGGDDLARGCAVRVDDIREMRGLLEQFFEIGARAHVDAPVTGEQSV